MTTKHRRKKKLVKPGLQLQLTSIFVGLTALALLLQFVLFTNVLHATAVHLPNDGALVLDEINRINLRVLCASFFVFLPVTLGVGVLWTFRIAGPVYRFERFLESIARGERPKDFRLRKGDQLHELAALLNEATRPMRALPATASEGAAPQDSPLAERAVSEPSAPLPGVIATAQTVDADLSR